MSFSVGDLTLVTNDDSDDKSFDPFQDIEVGDVTSFRDINFQSEEMRHLLKLSAPPDEEKYTSGTNYSANQMFPNWIIQNEDWQSTEAKNKENQISDILQTAFNQRSQEQTSTLIHWLMSVWETANLMGFKRCGAMTKVFHFLTYEANENIITEGERGLTFYIVISGQCAVHKEGIGIVAGLQKGQSFGELALTEGKDLRSATVRAVSRVELLRLHKIDYDHFVKDIQLAERRENLQVLRSCKLFENWSRAKVQKMVTTCLRKSYEMGDYIFHQGDVPDNIYFIIEGTVSIIKEIHIVVRNRWPTDVHEWDGVSKTKVKPHVVSELSRGFYFGELSILKNKTRTASAKAKTRCTLLCLDKLEFVHLLRSGKTMETISHFVGDYEDDRTILNRVVDLKGGPSTTAQLNEYVKTVEDLSSPIRPYSSPTPGDRTGNFSPSGRSKIMRIPTGIFEKTGPNHGLHFLKSGDKNTSRESSSSPPTERPSLSPQRESSKDKDPTVRRKSAGVSRLGVSAKLVGLSRSVAKFKEIRDKVNKNKIPSVLKFRRQLQAAAEATQANHPSGSIPSQQLSASVPLRIDDPHVAHAQALARTHGSSAVMVEEGEMFMRHVMEDVIKVNRKMKYFKHQTAPTSAGGIRSGEVTGHRSLRFSHPLSASPHHSAAMAITPTERRTFYLNQDIHSRERFSAGGKSKIKPMSATASNPTLQFSEHSQSQPILTSIDSVVLQTASGRKIKSKEARDIENFVGATMRGKPLPTKEIYHRSRTISPLNSDISLHESFGLLPDINTK